MKKLLFVALLGTLVACGSNETTEAPVETPAVETPAVETPVVDSTVAPIVDSTVAPEAPATEAPAETPAH